MFVFLKVFRQTLKLVFLMFYYVYMFCMLIIAFYINDPNIHITQVRRVASKSSFWRLLTTKQLPCYQDWEFDGRFLIQLLVFCDQKIDLIVKKIESRPMILLKDRRDLFAHGRSLYTGSIRSWSIRSTRVNRSRWSLKKIKDRREQFEFALLAKKLKRGGNCKKTYEYMVWERFAQITSKSISSLFFKDRRDWIVLVWSFSKIDESQSLTVDLFKRSTRAIWSWSIFSKDQRVLYDHSRSFLKIKKSKRAKIKRSNSQPCMLPIHIA